LYSWRSSAPLYYEFHGHTLNPDGSFGEAMLYRFEEGEASHGVVHAPLEGLHGWFFLNRTFDTPIEVELTLAGTYRLEPVRRQNIWRNSGRRLAECRPRLGVDVRRRACGAASADVRWSVA